jgi:Sec-independent protein secretion pathway component TatC
MAGPMLILYELSIVLARIFAKKPELAETSEY